jgi:RNA polymerase sigma-70 factor, ECF subfamily
LHVTTDILASSIKGDRAAQQKLYKLCYAQFMGLCWRYSGDKNQAVEYLNNGFVKIIFGLKKYNNEIPFDLWARKTLINSIIDDYRKSKVYNSRFSVQNEIKQEVRDEPTFTEYQQDMIDLIKQKIVLLPPTTCKVVNLYAFDGYKHKEIANMLNMTESTSMWHYSDGVRRLKEIIGMTALSQTLNP